MLLFTVFLQISDFTRPAPKLTCINTLVNQAQDEFREDSSQGLIPEGLTGWGEPKQSLGGDEEGISMDDQQPRTPSLTLFWLAAVTARQQDSNPYQTGILAPF